MLNPLSPEQIADSKEVGTTEAPAAPSWPWRFKKDKHAPCALLEGCRRVQVTLRIHHTANTVSLVPFPPGTSKCLCLFLSHSQAQMATFMSSPSQWPKSDKEVASFLQELCSIGNQGARSKSMGSWHLLGTPFRLPVFPTRKTPRFLRSQD